MDSASSMTGWTTLTADQNHNLRRMLDHLNQAVEGLVGEQNCLVRKKKKSRTKKKGNTVLRFLKIKKQKNRRKKLSESTGTRGDGCRPLVAVRGIHAVHSYYKSGVGGSWTFKIKI